MQSINIISQFSEWLNKFSWTAFLTLTFRFPVRKSALKYGRALVEAMAGQYGYARAFIAEEYHRDGERLHLHGLLYLPGGDVVDLTSVWKWWFKRFGRAKVERYQPGLGAHHYVAKYLLKEDLGVGDWDFFVFGVDKPAEMLY